MLKSAKFVAERVDAVEPSSAHRQRRLDELPAPHTTADIAARLGDTQDSAYPIYRATTLTTVILDAAAQSLTVWENTNPANTSPAQKWDLATFFG